jgi:hypothetical protein
MNNNANNNNNNMKFCKECNIHICKKNYARHCKSDKHKDKLWEQFFHDEIIRELEDEDDEREKVVLRAYLGEHYVSDDEDEE